MTSWQGKTPHSVHLKYYALCGLFFWLIIPIYLAWKKYQSIQYVHYYIDHTGAGILNHVNPDANRFIDLDRIKEIEVIQHPFNELKDILFYTQNMQIPPMIFNAVTMPDIVIDDLKKKIDETQSKKSVQMISLPVLQ